MLPQLPVWLPSTFWLNKIICVLRSPGCICTTYQSAGLLSVCVFVQRLTHRNCLCCSHFCVSYQNYCRVAQMFQMSPFGALECSLTARRAATFISRLRSNFTFNPQLETTDNVIAADKQGAKNETMHRCKMPRTHLPRTRTCYPCNAKRKSPSCNGQCELTGVKPATCSSLHKQINIKGENEPRCDSTKQNAGRLESCSWKVIKTNNEGRTPTYPEDGNSQRAAAK